VSVTDPFTESDRSRSAAYRQRVQKLNRIAGLSQLGIVGVAAFVAYHLQLSQKLEPYLWWSPLIVAIVVLGIASSAPGVITGSWLALVVNRQVGLSFAKARSWWRKTLRSWAVGIAYTLITGVCLWTAIRYATPWWVFAWVVLAGNVAVRYGVLAPLLLRAGNKTMPVPQSVLRTIETLSSQIGIRAPRSMIVSIESRTAPNASITGIGPFQRLMITEPAVSLPADELQAVIAHELAHIRNRDVEIAAGLLALLQVAIVLALRIYVLTPTNPPHSLNAGSYPAYVFISLIVNGYLAVIVLGLRRKQESRADQRALDATQDPAAFRSLMHRLATTNLIQIDPPQGTRALGCSHPAPITRIARASEWEARMRGSSLDPRTEEGEHLYPAMRKRWVVALGLVFSVVVLVGLGVASLFGGGSSQQAEPLVEIVGTGHSVKFSSPAVSVPDVKGSCAGLGGEADFLNGTSTTQDVVQIGGNIGLILSPGQEAGECIASGTYAFGLESSPGARVVFSVK